MQFTFRPLTRDDFPVLAGWLAAPHVARWWAHEYTPEALERDFGDSIDRREPGEDHVVLLDGRPIGHIQYSRFVDYPEYRDELSAVCTVDDGAASIDYFIGEPDLVGRGVGRAMITAFVDTIWPHDPTVTHLLVPVNSANVASWRMLLGAGFALAARGELDPDAPGDGRMHEILRFDRPATAVGI